MMKKLIMLLFALVLVFALASCGAVDVPADDAVTPNAPPAAEDVTDAPVVASGAVMQDVTVDIFGTAVPIHVVKDGSAFEFTYQFMGNDVYAKGTIGEDGAWNVEDTNNDFSVGTLDLLLPAIDESAWGPVTGVSAGESDETAVVVDVDMNGEIIPVTVVLTDTTVSFSYTCATMGNDVLASGTVSTDGSWDISEFSAGVFADGVWTPDSSGTDFAAIVVPLIQTALAQ